MKRMWFRLGVLALCFVSVSSAFAFNKIRNKHQYSSVSATATNTRTDLADPCYDVLILNDGANEVFVDLFDGIATTSDMQVKSGESISINNIATTSIGLICSTAETATVRIWCLEEDLR